MNEIAFILGTLLSCFFKDTFTVPFAYLDPSTGAMIISAIVGIFATIILAVKTYWYKLISLFKKKNNNQTDQSKVIQGKPETKKSK